MPLDVWSEFTFFDTFFQAQPMPTPMAWYFHQSPPALKYLAEIFMFAGEVVVPFFVFGNRFLRKTAFWVFVAISVLIQLNCPVPTEPVKIRIQKQDTVTLFFRSVTSKKIRFDGSAQPATYLPLRIVSGRNDVLPKFDTALIGHSAGDTVRVKINPDNAYGSNGLYYVKSGGNTQYIVPPNDTITMEGIILTIARHREDR